MGAESGYRFDNAARQPPPRNYYEILGIGYGASSAEISKAFKRLSREKHPDIGGDEEAYKDVTEAYNALRDSETRSKYDRKTFTTASSTNSRAENPQPRREENFTESSASRSGFGFGQDRGRSGFQTGPEVGNVAKFGKRRQKFESGGPGVMVEDDGNGLEYLVDPNTGTRISGPYKELMLKDGFLMGLEDKTFDMYVIDRQTGKILSKPYKLIQKRDSKLMGCNFIGSWEEIRF